MVENQIAQWLQNGGEDNLQNKGQQIPVDRHRHVANSLGLSNDYIHSKILKDNNIKPESIQRRIDMDESWNELQHVIQQDYYL